MTLTTEQIQPYDIWWPKMRADIEELLRLGVKYRYGAEARADRWPPEFLDCSEWNELLYSRREIPLSDGAWNQWKECVPAGIGRPGDLGFWQDYAKAKPGRDGIYHTGMLWINGLVVEMRAKDKKGRYGRLITRPRTAWESWEAFKAAGGWRRPKILTPYHWMEKTP